MPQNLGLSYEETRNENPDAPTVILLPGVGCGIRFWDNLVPVLSPHFRVVAFSNPGLDNSPLSLIFTVEDLAASVLARLDELDIRTCHLVGHSMGGYTAQHLVALAPERFRRLVFLSTSMGGTSSDEDVARVLAHMLPIWPQQRTLLKTNPYEAFKFAVGRNIPKTNPKGYQDFVESRINPKIPESIYAIHFLCALKSSSHILASNIAQPALVVHGNDDNIIHISGGKALARTLLNGFFLEKDCGHIPTFEVPRIHQDILTFLQGGSVGTQLMRVEITPQDLAQERAWRSGRNRKLGSIGAQALLDGGRIGLKYILRKIL